MSSLDKQKKKVTKIFTKDGLFAEIIKKNGKTYIKIPKINYR